MVCGTSLHKRYFHALLWEYSLCHIFTFIFSSFMCHLIYMCVCVWAYWKDIYLIIYWLLNWYNHILVLLWLYSKSESRKCILFPAIGMNLFFVYKRKIYIYIHSRIQRVRGRVAECTRPTRSTKWCYTSPLHIIYRYWSEIAITIVKSISYLWEYLSISY